MTETPAEAWARCRGFIEAALSEQGGGHTIEDVQAGIEAGRFHFWAGERAAIVTEFWNEPHMRTLNLWLAGGDLKEVVAIIRAAEAFAQAQGCGRLVAGVLHSRKGWERIGQALGMAPRWTIFAKELTG